jgi:hypothetical protein
MLVDPGGFEPPNVEFKARCLRPLGDESTVVAPREGLEPSSYGFGDRYFAVKLPRCGGGRIESNAIPFGTIRFQGGSRPSLVHPP